MKRTGEILEKEANESGKTVKKLINTGKIRGIMKYICEFRVICLCNVRRMPGRGYRCFLKGIHIFFYCLTVFSMLELGNSFLHDGVND